MANQSQCLEDAPGRWPRGEPSSPELYSEAQRLALEELVAGGRAAFRAFLRREKVPGFLSEPEIQAVLQAAAPPAGAENGAAEPSLSASLDCSSLTYFPEQSDVEPPVLELGWPAFSTGSYRGLTRVEALFQPSFGETIYSCKEAVRRQIRSAREVSPQPGLCAPFLPEPPAPGPASLALGNPRGAALRSAPLCLGNLEPGSWCCTKDPLVLVT